MEAEAVRKTGLPSIDQPWRKYYTEAALQAEIPFKTVYHTLADNNPPSEKSALLYFGRKISFRELYTHIQEAARAFTALGVKEGDIVTIFSTNTPEVTYCIYALNYLGAIANMEYVTASGKDAVAAVERCHSKIVLVLDVLQREFTALDSCPTVEHIISLPVGASMPFPLHTLFRIQLRKHYVFMAKKMSYADFIRGGAGQTAVEAPFRPDTPAFIVHSGGTSGIPKGVLLSNENISYICWTFLFNSPDVESGDIYMACIPLFHAFGLCMGVIAPLAHSLAVVLTPQFNEKSLISNFKKYKPAYIIASGAHIPALINDPAIQKMDLSFFKTCGYGGSPLSVAQEIELDQFLQAHNAPARPSAGYGMSEVSSAICAERNCYYGKVGSVGIPLCRVNVKVLDIDTGEELGYNQSGELCFSAPSLMLGYFKNDEENAKALFTDEEGNRWVHTGDLGRVDEDGFVFITGRLKRIYSVRDGKGGTMFKLFPDYVASEIDKVENVLQSAVICLEHPDYKHVAVAYVVLKDPAKEAETGKAIRDYMAENLPRHSIPKAIRYLSAMPQTAIGKPDFRELELDAAGLTIV